MPRTGENIYKRKDGRWEGRYIKARTWDGKAQYGYLYAKTYKEVKKKLCEAILKNENKEISNKNETKKLFEDVAENWLHLIQVQIKASTYIRYRNLLNTYIYPHFSKRPIMDITTQEVNEYCNELRVSGGKYGQGLSAKMVSDILSVIRSVLRHALSQGLYVRCRAETICIRQNPKAIHILSFSEQKQLYNYLIEHPSSMNFGILLCLYTGMRIGELCALRWEDISLTENTIYIHRTMQRLQIENPTHTKTKVIITSPKSGHSVRLIPLPDQLDFIRNNFHMTGYVLTGSEAFVEPRTMQNYFKRLLNEIQIEPINFHALRHTFATRCIEAGVDLKTLSEILGHSSVSITMNRYVHPTMQMKRDNMKRFSNLFLVK